MLASKYWNVKLQSLGLRACIIPVLQYRKKHDMMQISYRQCARKAIASWLEVRFQFWPLFFEERKSGSFELNSLVAISDKGSQMWLRMSPSSFLHCAEEGSLAGSVALAIRRCVETFSGLFYTGLSRDLWQHEMSGVFTQACPHELELHLKTTLKT